MTKARVSWAFSFGRYDPTVRATRYPATTRRCRVVRRPEGRRAGCFDADGEEVSRHYRENVNSTRHAAYRDTH